MPIPRPLLVMLALVLPMSCAAEPVRAPVMQERPAGAPVDLFDPDVHMRSADARPGMRGYGLSVFKGTQIERFEIEVLSVVPRREQVGSDMVLVRASGANLEHTGPIAGMSGSPVYVFCDDGRERLLGAIAFGWPGLKEPIAGVQPIEGMLGLQTTLGPQPMARAEAGELGTRGWNLAAAAAFARLAKQEPRSLAELFSALGLAATQESALPNGLAPLAIPLSASGLSTGAIGELAGVFGGAGARFAGVAPAGGPSSADRIEPGSPLAVPVLLGDMNLVATGTCTAVIGDQVFGFGHPLVGEGTSGLPMAAGEINAVIPTLDISFKIGTPGKLLGTLASDATPGIAGKLGDVPEMIPVTLRLKRGQTQRSFSFAAAQHRQMTLAALAAAFQTATELEGMPDPMGATRWDVLLRYSGGHELRLKDVGANDNPFGAGGVIGAIALPLMAVQENPFARVSLESVEASVELMEAADARLATLEQIWLPRTRYRPGETVQINLSFRLWRGQRVARTLEMRLPDDLPPGQYPLTITESVGAMMTAMEARPFEFEVKSLQDMFAVLNSMQNFGSDAVYARLDRPEEVRVAVGRQSLPDLPDSRALLLAESGRSDVTPYAPAVAAKLEVPYVVNEGEAQAMITVIRP